MSFLLLNKKKIKEKKNIKYRYFLKKKKKINKLNRIQNFFLKIKKIKSNN
jgi:hypothetical protein